MKPAALHFCNRQMAKPFKLVKTLLPLCLMSCSRCKPCYVKFGDMPRHDLPHFFDALPACVDGMSSSNPRDHKYDSGGPCTGCAGQRGWVLVRMEQASWAQLRVVK